MIMRTTVNIDDDVLIAAKATATTAHSSVGAVLSDWTRRGQLQALRGPVKACTRQRQTRNGIALLPKRGVTVTSEQLYRLLDNEAAQVLSRFTRL